MPIVALTAHALDSERAVIAGAGFDYGDHQALRARRPDPRDGPGPRHGLAIATFIEDASDDAAPEDAAAEV